MFVVTQAKNQSFQCPAATDALLSVCVCVCYSTHICPFTTSSPSSFTRPPRQRFHIDSSALWGSVTTGQLQAKIRTGFIFSPNTFLLKGN